ncbi:ethionine resistance protein [Coemansia sp. RSA 2050]|nr:ethionine resistance protein [Coemansia sp. RSA 2050]KAJ2731819.1 ethionine resistance protein [Coemansia sp. BCRC 34962]
MSFSSRGTRHTPTRAPPPIRRLSLAHAPMEQGKPSNFIPAPMLTPAPTPVRNLPDHSQAAPPPRLQRSLTTGTTRGQMSPWAHYSGDQQRAGAPPPLALESARLRNVSPYHAAQQSPAAAVGGRTPTQYPAQFLACSLAASPASPWAQSPQRSLSRRQSIVLQSSCSGHLCLESPNRDRSSVPPPLPPTGLADPQSMASTKSLPHGPCAVADVQRSRRRSMAHERYPPLVSIFEASAALSLAYDVEPYGEEEDPHLIIGYEGDRIVTRGPSATSLASAFSVLPASSSPSSSSSSSSSVSSYSYIFDTARPSATAIASGELQTARKQNTNCTHLASYYGYSLAGSLNNHRPLVSTSILLGTGDLCFGTMADVRPLPELSLPAADGVFPTERAPLLAGDSSATLSTGSDWQQRQSTASLIAREARSLLHSSSHLLLGNLLQAVISISQVASSGHLGTRELAAIGLAHIVVILTGYPIAFAVLGCLETCASQAFTSARPRLVGGYFVRALQMQWGMGLALAPLWLNASTPLTYLLDDAETVAMAAEYLRWYFVPFLVFSNMLCARQILYAQGITYPAPYLTLLGALLTMAFQYLLVFAPYFEMGVRGIAVASGLSYLAMLLATLAVIVRNDVKRISGSQAPWRPMLRLLPYSLALALFSTGTSELVTVVAAHLGPAALTTQAVLSALSRILSITSSSIGVAALNRLGNLIGLHAPRHAHAAALTALSAAALVAVLAFVALLVAPHWWIHIFTSDEHTVEQATRVLPIVALAFAAQTLAFVASQLLAAQGRQSLAVRIKFGVLYVVAVPLAYYWTISRDCGLAGLWAAVATGHLATAVMESLVVLKTDWASLVDKCAYITQH